MVSRSLDISGLNAGAERTARHVVAWLRRATATEKYQGRYEIVAGEGRVKVAHESHTVAPEDMLV